MESWYGTMKEHEHRHCDLLRETARGRLFAALRAERRAVVSPAKMVLVGLCLATLLAVMSQLS